MANGDLSKVARMFSAAIKESKKTTSAYDTQATVVRTDGQTAWVHIPGGVDETPARMTMNASPGDTVQVRIAGGRAWLTGNASAPPTDDKLAKAATIMVQTVQTYTEKVSARVAVIEDAYITTLQVNTLLADYTQTTELVATYATIDSLTAATGRISTLEATTLTAEQAALTYATIGNLNAATGRISTLEANSLTVQQAALTYATIDSLTAATGRISTLEANSLTAEQAALTYATITNLDAAVGRITTLEANSITADYADLHYATIDMANVQEGSITNALIAAGAIETAQIADGSITSAKIVELDASKITTGTLDASNLNVINLNAASITVGTINGQQISPGAIEFANLSQEVVDEIDASTIWRLVTTYEFTETQYTFAAHLLYGKNEVTTVYEGTKYKWTIRNEDGERYLGNGYTVTFSRDYAGYAGTVVCSWSDTDEADVVSANDETIVGADGSILIGIY